MQRAGRVRRQNRVVSNAAGAPTKSPPTAGPTCFILSGAVLMVDSVNIDTGEMNTFLLTHVDDEGQPFSSDIDI
jgi:hypothetical protein